MPATTEYVPLVSPTRYLTGLLAVHAALVALPDCKAVLNVWGALPMAIAQDATMWPPGGAKFMAVTSRGARRRSEEIRGTTAGEFSGAISVAVIARDDDAATNLTTLDAAEVAAVNAIMQLEATTQSEQDQWDPRVTLMTPIVSEEEGAAFPYAGTEITVILWSYE